MWNRVIVSSFRHKPRAQRYFIPFRIICSEMFTYRLLETFPDILNGTVMSLLNAVHHLKFTALMDRDVKAQHIQMRELLPQSLLR